jgi:hypothetical protein
MLATNTVANGTVVLPLPQPFPLPVPPAVRLPALQTRARCELQLPDLKGFKFVGKQDWTHGAKLPAREDAEALKAFYRSLFPRCWKASPRDFAQRAQEDKDCELTWLAWIVNELEDQQVPTDAQHVAAMKRLLKECGPFPSLALLASHCERVAQYGQVDDKIRLALQCGMDNYDLQDFLKLARKEGIPLSPKRVPRLVLRAPQSSKKAGTIGEGAYNAVWKLSWEDPETRKKVWYVYKPEQSSWPSELDPTEFATARGWPIFTDTSGRNLAASTICQMLGWDVYVKCEPAYRKENIGIVMETAAGQHLLFHDKVKLPKRSKKLVGRITSVRDANGAQLHELVSAMHKDKLVAIRGADEGMALFYGEGVWREHILQPSIARQFLQLTWLAFICAHLDGHVGNFKFDPSTGKVKAYDFDFTFCSKVRSVESLGLMDRLNLQHMQYLPPAVDSDMYWDLGSRLNKDKVRQALKDYLRPAEIEATLARIALLQRHLQTIPRYKPEEFNQYLHLFLEKPWTSYLGLYANAREEG